MQIATEVQVTHQDKVVACSPDLRAKYPEADVLEIAQFESIDEAVEFFTQEKDGAVIVNGTKEVVSLINSAHRQNEMNGVRANFARPRSAYTVLRERAKKDPAAREKLQAVLAELGLEGLEL